MNSENNSGIPDVMNELTSLKAEIRNTKYTDFFYFFYKEEFLPWVPFFLNWNEIMFEGGKQETTIFAILVLCPKMVEKSIKRPC